MLRLCRLPKLSHHVSRHISRQHLLPKIHALEPSLLSLLVGGALPHYPSPVYRFQLIPCGLAGAADNANFIPEVFPQAHPIKQADQGIKFTL